MALYDQINSCYFHHPCNITTVHTEIVEWNRDTYTFSFQHFENDIDADEKILKHEKVTQMNQEQKDYYDSNGGWGYEDNGNTPMFYLTHRHGLTHKFLNIEVEF